MIVNLILIFLLLGAQSGLYLSGPTTLGATNGAESVQPARINPENIGVKVSALHFVAIDVATGSILLQKEADVKQPIASITKLMTALVILDQKPDWQKEVELKEVDETDGAQPHIYRGERVRFIDLWKAALVSSDNNSIKAMIRSLGLSPEEFIAAMNKKSAEIGLYNTVFSDPTGLSLENVSSALDLSILINEALKKNEIKESVLQGKYSFSILNKRQSRVIYNTDILLDSFLNKGKYGYELLGGKTGFLPEAGYCLGVKISRESHSVAIVVLGSSSMVERFADVKAIADWIFSNYKW